MRREPLTGRLSLLSWFNHIQAAPHRPHFFQTLEISLFTSCSFRKTNNSGSVFPHVLESRIYQTKFLHTSAFVFPFSFCIILTFPSMLIPCLLFATSHCITRPVSCYLQKEKCRANCRYYCYFPGLNLCGYLKA